MHPSANHVSGDDLIKWYLPYRFPEVCHLHTLTSLSRSSVDLWKQRRKNIQYLAHNRIFVIIFSINHFLVVNFVTCPFASWIIELFISLFSLQHQTVIKKIYFYISICQYLKKNLSHAFMNGSSRQQKEHGRLFNDPFNGTGTNVATCGWYTVSYHTYHWPGIHRKKQPGQKIEN